MPGSNEAKITFRQASARVKCTDLHPTEPWVLCALYNGTVAIYNYSTKQTVRSFEVCRPPVRTAKFIARRQQFVCGTDEKELRVYDYNTMERVKVLPAHTDYIRSLAVHPSQPYVLSAGDDGLIRLWNWEKNWACVNVFEGHSHYIMQVAFNPKDTNTFASASLDGTVRVWNLHATQPAMPNFTLSGHSSDVNSVDYYPGGDKPYLASGSDDNTVRVWDYQSKAQIATLTGHANNVTAVVFHPTLPYVIAGSEDGSVRVWHSGTYRLEQLLTFGMGRVWSLSVQPNSNRFAIGYDDGVIVCKLGTSRPAFSMDSNGKALFNVGPEVRQCVVRATPAGVAIVDGEPLPAPVKEIGSCEFTPLALRHSPNGRFCAAVSETEFVVYTALSWRQLAFGSGTNLVWSADSTCYAVLESNRRVRVFSSQQNTEKASFAPPFQVDTLFGGPLLGLRGQGCVAFFDWDSLSVVRRIDDLAPNKVVWADSGLRVALISRDVLFLLAYNPQHSAPTTAAGAEDAFEVVADVNDQVRSGCWYGECFIYSTRGKRLNYCVEEQVSTVAHLDSAMYVLGYLPKENRVYLFYRETIYSYALSSALLSYMCSVAAGDADTARTVLKDVPDSERSRIARFMEQRGLLEDALRVSNDVDHQFEIAMQLKRLDLAAHFTRESPAPHKWRQVADLALREGDWELAKEGYTQATDLSSLLMLYTALSDREGLEQLAELAQEDRQFNVAFAALFSLQRLDDCIDLLLAAKRVPEAAFFARTYRPSRVSEIVRRWKRSLQSVNALASEALADPVQMPDAFPDFSLGLTAERLLEAEREEFVSAGDYPDHLDDTFRDVVAAVRAQQEADADGDFVDAPNAEVDAAPSTPAPAPGSASRAASSTPAAADDDDNDGGDDSEFGDADDDVPEMGDEPDSFA